MWLLSLLDLSSNLFPSFIAQFFFRPSTPFFLQHFFFFVPFCTFSKVTVVARNRTIYKYTTYLELIFTIPE